MKKIFLLCCFLLFLSFGYSQTLTTTATTIASGGTVTVTGSGESNSSTGTYFNAEQSESVTATNPSNSLSSISLFFKSATYFNKTTQAPTSLVFTLVNNSAAAVTVTFEVVIEGYNNGTLGETKPQTFKFTVTVNPAPTTPPPPLTVYAKLVATVFSPSNGQVANDWQFLVSVNFYPSENSTILLSVTDLPVSVTITSPGRTGPVTTTKTYNVTGTSFWITEEPIASDANNDKPALPTNWQADYKLNPSSGYTIF